MFVQKNNTYTQVKPQQENALKFFSELENNYSKFKDEHLIIDFSEEINIKIADILLFLNMSKRHKNNGTSFVIVCNDVDIDSISEELSIVPTFLEALDVIEMDAIERDLGF